MLSSTNIDDIQMKMTRRPLSGVTSIKGGRKNWKKTRPAILNRDQKSMLLND